MKFIKVESFRPVAEHLADTLNHHLIGGKNVFWLLPGGSAMAAAIEASKHLKSRHLKNLAVTLSDERYGEVGHDDSNWQQLKNAGFALSGARLIPVLQGQDIKKTVQKYENALKGELKNADYSLGLFGVGADGHIAGVKPGSPAVRANHLASGYKWTDFSRITITPRALVRLDEAVVYMTGREKRPVIKQLRDSPLTLNEQPAQILKSIKKVTVYNDYLSS